MASGRVVEFDGHKGYGTVRDGDTGAEYFFHCTQIADGSRTIAVGTEVSFAVRPGRLGRWEATQVNQQPAA